jgi:hypothetical protein
VTPNIIDIATIEETIRTDDITPPTTTGIVGTMTIMTTGAVTNPGKREDSLDKCPQPQG